MIHILFAPGGFGSTLEWSLRNYSIEYESTAIGFNNADGSMHKYEKMYHPLNYNELLKIETFPENTITTPIYPMKDFKPSEIINFFNTYYHEDKKIFTRVDNIELAEIILLLAWNKIGLGAGHLFNLWSTPEYEFPKSWDPSYQSWKDMEFWELREWFSIYYSGWVHEWIDAAELVSETDNWLSVSPLSLINDFKTTVRQCVEFCNLHYNENINADIESSGWVNSQKNIVKQHSTLKQIVENTINNNEVEFEKLTIVAQAIIQKRLRDQGYELRCFALNEFPTNTKDLYNLLDHVTG